MQTFVLNIKILVCRLFADPLFIIKIENGKVIQVTGSIKKGYIAYCHNFVKEHGIQFGFIYAVKGQYGKAILKVSGEIPKELHQQLRNIWNLN